LGNKMFCFLKIILLRFNTTTWINIWALNKK
jgi:hypothetical protein